jgi:endonuclease YncB( thermonuclease family)
VAKFQAFPRPLMIFLIAFALMPFAASAAEIMGQASVTDGDTLAIGTTKIRLHGIDAPKSGQICQGVSGQDYDCSGVATRALRALVKDRTISCEAKDTDQYGRTVAICHVGQLDLGARMVEQGHALAFRRYALDYVAQEDQARGAKRGMCQAPFSPPGNGVRPSARRRTSKLRRRLLRRPAARSRATLTVRARTSITLRGREITHGRRSTQRRASDGFAPSQMRAQRGGAPRAGNKCPRPSASDTRKRDAKHEPNLT